MNDFYTPYTILIGTSDVSGNVLIDDTGDISLQLDVTRVTEFNTSTFSFVISTEDREWCVGNENNGFVKLGYDISGAGAEITVLEGEEVVYLGEILKTTELISQRALRVDVTDSSKKLRDTQVKDFGIERNFVLQRDQASNHGRYPLPTGLAPISDDSFSGSSGTTSLIERDSLLSEGVLSPFNVQISGNVLQSEGGPLPQDPAVQLKTSYRNKRTTFLLNQILDKYGINLSSISIDDLQLANEIFSTNGRVGYDIEATDSSTPQYTFWSGYATDYIYLDDKFYFLYSCNAAKSRPRLLEYDTQTDTWNVFFTRESFAEWWGLAAADHDTFYILGTEGKTASYVAGNGIYDPTRPNPVTFIERVIRGGSRETYIPSTHTYRPVVGMYYFLGYNNDVGEDQGIKPDTRAGFIYAGGRVYYRYANASSCGVARSSSLGNANPFVQIQKDGKWNHLGVDFDIAGNELVAAAIWQNGITSTRKIFKKQI